MEPVSFLNFTSGKYEIVDAAARDSIQNLKNELGENMRGELVSCLDARTFADYIPGVTQGDLLNMPTGYMQGMTVTATSYIFACKGADEFQDNDYVKLLEIQKGTSQVLRTAQIVGYHANALAYNAEAQEIYIACNSSASEGGTIPNNNILIVDYVTLTVKDTITPPTEITTQNRVRSVSYDNTTKTIMLGDESTVYFMTDWETVDRKLELDMTDTLAIPATTNVQTLKHCGNFILQSRMSPNGLCIYNATTGKLIKQYFDLRVCDLIATGEMEDAEIDAEGNIYFATCQTIRYSTAIYTFDYTIFKSNVYKNGFQRQPYQTQKGNALQAYVDPTSTALQLGTASNPFGSPNQGLLMANSMPLDCGIRLNCASEADYGWFGGIFGNQPIYLDGNGKATLHAIANLSSDLIVDSCTIDANPYVNLNTTANPTNVYLAQSSNTEFRSCTFDSGSTKQNNAMLVANSKVYVNGCTIKGYTNGIRLQTNADVMVYNVSWSGGDWKYMCNVPQVKLYDDKSTVYENCNPEGYVPDNIGGSWTSVEFTQTGDVVTVENPKTVTNKMRLITVSWQYQSTTVHYTTFLSAGYVNHCAGFSSPSYITMFYISMTDNDAGKLNFNWSLYQQSRSGGAWSDMSDDVTFKVTSIRVLP